MLVAQPSIVPFIASRLRSSLLVCPRENRYQRVPWETAQGRPPVQLGRVGPLEGRVPERSAGTPPGFNTRIEAWTELIRWGPSLFSHSELLLLLFYAERTLPYAKSTDRASLNQIRNGIYSRPQNRWIRAGAGLSASAIKKANTTLSERGVLIRRRCNPRVRYPDAVGAG